METLPLSNFIEQQKEFVTIKDNHEYTRVTTKLHRRGVVLRDVVKGFEIKTKRQQVCRADQLLIAEIDAKVGGYGIVPKELEGAIVSSHYFLFDINTDRLLPKYLAHILKTDGFFDQIKAQGSTNYASIRPKDVLGIEIPYCSAALQESIADRLDKMTLRIVDLGKNIQTEKDYISKLRLAILREAVSGKLVPQDPEDDPASDLLKKIKNEKERLIREKRIKRERDFPSIPEESSNKLPIGWEWARLADVAANESYSLVDGPFGSNLKRQHYTDAGIRIIQLQNVGRFTWKDSNKTFTSTAKADELIRSNAYPGDLVITKMFPIARTTIIPPLEERYVLCSDCIRMKPHETVNKQYLVLLLNSETYVNSISMKSRGITRKRVGLGDIKSSVIPVPPFNEQCRIVEKVDKLLRLINDLERQTGENQRDLELLMEVVLKEAFAS